MPSTLLVVTAVSTFLLAFSSRTLAADATQLRLINNFRAANGVAALVELSALDSCAYAHSVDMATKIGDMSHYGSDGSTFATRVYKCVGSSTAGENVAKGYQYVQNVFAAWQASTAHRENMLNPNFNVVGFGTYNGYWTQNFAYIAGVKAPTTTTTTTRRTTTTTTRSRTTTSGGSSVTSAAASESPSETEVATDAEEAEPTYIPPESGVLLDVDSDSYIVPVTESSSTNGTTYDDSDGNASIYEGDEEALASKSSLLMAKMDASAYQVYLTSKNTSVMNPFLVVSFESAGIHAIKRLMCAEAFGFALAVIVATVGTSFGI